MVAVGHATTGPMGGRRPRRRRGGRQIGDEWSELAFGARGESELQPLLELLRGQPALAGGGAEAVRSPLAVGVGRPQPAHRKNCPWKPKGMWCGASARATSSKEPASSTRRNERPARVSSTTDSTTPASSASAPGSRTNTGSPG